MKNKFLISSLVIILLAMMAYLMITSSQGDSATTDESSHIVSGYLSLKYGDFQVNPEHPFLGKQLAALPLLFLNLNFDRSYNLFKVESDFYYDSWRETRQFANDFLYKMGNNADQILQSARMVPMFFALVLGLTIFWVSYKFYGWKASIFALLFYAFSPLVLAHARLANTDLWLTLFFFLSAVTFGSYLENPSKKRLIVAGLCFGLALVVKFSALTLIPVLITIWVVKLILDHKGRKNIFTSIFQNLPKGLFIFLAIFFIGFFVIWADYKFTNNIIPPYQPINEQYYYNPNLLKYEKFFRIIEPVQYWKGITIVLGSVTGQQPCSLLGQVKPGGWWYYFPIAFVVKTPFPTLILLVLMGILYIKWRKQLDFKDYLLIIPIAVYFLISMKSTLNIGIRHLMPIFPFIFLLNAKFITDWLQKSDYQWKKYTVFLFVIILSAWYVYGTIRVYPHFLSYFNEITGPENGIKVLGDSNIDWGQDLKRLKKWLDNNQITEPILLEYFWDGEDAPTYYGINYRKLEPGNPNQKGYIVVGVGSLLDSSYSWLQNYQPIARIGYSINIYKIE